MEKDRFSPNLLRSAKHSDSVLLNTGVLDTILHYNFNCILWLKNSPSPQKSRKNRKIFIYTAYFNVLYLT